MRDPTHSHFLAAFFAATVMSVGAGPPAARPACYAPPGGPAALGVPNLVADRDHENRSHLPWTDRTAPVVILDEGICRRAARAYLRDTLNLLPDSVLRASVVRAGGLYFVRAIPVLQAGEFTITAVLDSSFRWIIGITG